MLAACFTFIFFGPLEVVAFGGDTLNYTYKDVLLPLALFALAVFAAGSLLIALLRGKIFNYTVCVLSALTLCGYLQAALMNGSLGTLTGETIDWVNHKTEMVLNLAVWAVVLIVFLLIMYLNRKLWRGFVLSVSVLLVVMQAAPTVGILAGAYAEAETDEISDYFLSADGMFDYSSENNTFVFVVDYMDYNFVKGILEKDPTFFDALDGFTGYTGAISTYCRTQPALSNILTGCTDLAYNVPTEEFYEKSWTSDGKNILADIKAQGYETEIYASVRYLFSDADYASEYVSNFQSSKDDMIYSNLISKMMCLSAYRYAPTAIKPFYWSDTNFYNADIFDTTGIQRYTYGDGNYKTSFLSATADKEQGNFKFYHLNGSHPPHTLNSDGTYSDTGTDAVTQTMGVFNILYGAFDRMKELGIYDDATIIITADHGNVSTLVADELTPIKIGLFYKPSGSAGTPITWSNAQVSSANLPATILKSTGADYGKYGKALDDIGENEQTVRKFYRIIMDTTDWLDKSWQKYEVTGDASDISNWKLIESSDVKYKFY